MYVSGTQFDLENRLHQMATTIADVEAFAAEASTYNYDVHQKHKINKELQKKAYSTTGDAVLSNEDYLT